MRRTALVLALSLAVGFAVGMIGSQVLYAQQEPLKRTVLFKTDLAGIEGREAILVLVEVAPGVVAGKHYHPGHEISYVLEGAVILQTEGKPPVTFKAGDANYLPAKQVHNVKNASKANPAKALLFYIVGKGQPLAVPVK